MEGHRYVLEASYRDALGGKWYAAKGNSAYAVDGPSRFHAKEYSKAMLFRTARKALLFAANPANYRNPDNMDTARVIRVKVIDHPAVPAQPARREVVEA